MTRRPPSPARWPALALALAGCSGLEVVHTYEPLAFHRWRGYAWARGAVAAGQAGAPVTPELASALVSEVDATLPGRGLTLAHPDDADAIVRCVVTDLGEGRASLQVHLSAPRFPDAWCGEARGALLVAGDEEETAERLRAAAREVLEGFPPPRPRVGR